MIRTIYTEKQIKKAMQTKIHWITEEEKQEISFQKQLKILVNNLKKLIK